MPKHQRYCTGQCLGWAAGQQMNRQLCGLKWIGKPDSVMTRKMSHSDHSSCPKITQGVERPYPRAMGGPPNPPIWPCSGWGLPCVRHRWRTGELLPRLFNLTRRDTVGGMFSVVLSPDHAGPSLTATLSFGVRTFLPPCISTESDRLIHFSPQLWFSCLIVSSVANRLATNSFCRARGQYAMSPTDATKPSCAETGA